MFDAPNMRSFSKERGWSTKSMWFHKEPGTDFFDVAVCLMSVFFPPYDRRYNVSFLSGYYRPDGTDDHPFICSTERDNGMLRCSDVPRRRVGRTSCFLGAEEDRPDTGLRQEEPGSCVNWYQYYNECRAGEINPHKGAINFDNIGYAWIAIFQVKGFKHGGKWTVTVATHQSLLPFSVYVFHSGDHSGRMGGHHVLCHGRTFLLQLHLLYFSHYSKYKNTHKYKKNLTISQPWGVESETRTWVVLRLHKWRLLNWTRPQKTWDLTSDSVLQDLRLTWTWGWRLVSNLEFPGIIVSGLRYLFQYVDIIWTLCKNIYVQPWCYDTQHVVTEHRQIQYQNNTDHGGG